MGEKKFEMLMLGELTSLNVRIRQGLGKKLGRLCFTVWRKHFSWKIRQMMISEVSCLDQFAHNEEKIQNMITTPW